MTAIPAIQVFRLPPLGKPARGADYAQARVPQPPQKGDTCWYYVLNMAGRERFAGRPGKLSPADLQGRIAEMDASKLRKEFSKISAEEEVVESKIQLIARFITGAEQLPQLQVLSAANLGQYLEGLDLSAQKNLNGNALKTHAAMIKILREFCVQTEVVLLNDYPKYLKSRILQSKIQILEQYLAKRKISAESEVVRIALLANRVFVIQHLDQGLIFNDEERRALIKYAIASKPVGEIDDQQRMTALFFVVKADIQKRLGFKYAEWEPRQNFATFAQSLQDHGAHGVSGLFGRLFYQAPPLQLSETIEGRPVFGWSVNVKRHDITSIGDVMTHAILVVGASKTREGKEYVYYMDPKDGTDPQNVASQVLYKVSYAKFVEYTRNLEGACRCYSTDPITGQQIPVVFDSVMSSKETGLHYAYYLDSKKSS